MQMPQGWAPRTGGEASLPLLRPLLWLYRHCGQLGSCPGSGCSLGAPDMLGPLVCQASCSAWTLLPLAVPAHPGLMHHHAYIALSGLTCTQGQVAELSFESIYLGSQSKRWALDRARRHFLKCFSVSVMDRCQTWLSGKIPGSLACKA